jgi:hypothetical protein
VAVHDYYGSIAGAQIVIQSSQSAGKESLFTNYYKKRFSTFPPEIDHYPV